MQTIRKRTFQEKKKNCFNYPGASVFINDCATKKCSFVYVGYNWQWLHMDLVCKWAITSMNMPHLIISIILRSILPYSEFCYHMHEYHFTNIQQSAKTIMYFPVQQTICVIHFECLRKCFCFFFVRELLHDDVMKWRLSHSWPFVRGATGQRWIPFTKGRWCGALMSACENC